MQSTIPRTRPLSTCGIGSKRSKLVIWRLSSIINSLFKSTCGKIDDLQQRHQRAVSVPSGSAARAVFEVLHELLYAQKRVHALIQRLFVGDDIDHICSDLVNA